MIALKATRAEKIKAATAQSRTAEDALRRYFDSDFTDDGVRVFLLSRAERARAELQRVRGQS